MAKVGMAGSACIDRRFIDVHACCFDFAGSTQVGIQFTTWPRNTIRRSRQVNVQVIHLPIEYRAAGTTHLDIQIFVLIETGQTGFRCARQFQFVNGRVP